MVPCLFTFLVFFFNDTATTEIYTLSLHDALPISPIGPWNGAGSRAAGLLRRRRRPGHAWGWDGRSSPDARAVRDRYTRRLRRTESFRRRSNTGPGGRTAE